MSVFPPNQDIETKQTDVLDHGHEAVGGAEFRLVDDVGDRGPHDGRNQREGHAHHSHWDVEIDLGVGHHKVNGDEEDRAEHHEESALADAINPEAKDRGGDHGKQRQHTGEETTELTRGAMGFDEKLHGKGLEREDGRVEGNAKSDDVPVADAELEEVGEDDLVGGGVAQVEVALGVDLEDPVDDGAHDAKDGKRKGNQEGPAPVGVSGACPGGGIEGGEGAEPADGEVEAEGEAEFLAFEPSRKSGGDGNVERFGAHAEDEAAGGHDRQRSRGGCNGRADQRKQAEDHQRFSEAQAVDDESADDHGEDIRKAVDGLQEAEIFVGKVQLRL